MKYPKEGMCDYCYKIKKAREFTGKYLGKGYKICKKCEDSIKNMK